MFGYLFFKTPDIKPVGDLSKKEQISFSQPTANPTPDNLSGFERTQEVTPPGSADWLLATKKDVLFNNIRCYDANTKLPCVAVLPGKEWYFVETINSVEEDDLEGKRDAYGVLKEVKVKYANTPEWMNLLTGFSRGDSHGITNPFIDPLEIYGVIKPKGYFVGEVTYVRDSGKSLVFIVSATIVDNKFRQPDYRSVNFWYPYVKEQRFFVSDELTYEEFVKTVTPVPSDIWY